MYCQKGIWSKADIFLLSTWRVCTWNLCIYIKRDGRIFDGNIKDYNKKKNIL